MKRDENQNVEYKASWQDKYLEWICGYANAEGGTIYFGIEDGTKRPIGVEKANKLMEDIPNKIRDTLGIVADVKFLKKSGKDVIRVKVKRSAFPVSYKGGFHFRSGAVKMQLKGPALTQFLMERSGLEWDACLSSGGHRKRDWTFIKLKNRYREEHGVPLKDSDFLSFGLANENGLLTNTGVLMADECPLSHSRVFCTRWNGLDMTAGVMDANDDLEYSGGLLQLLQSAEDFIRLHSRNAWHKRPHDRVNFREYPERAVQEILINALVHRDYLEYGSEVHVDIFDDRMEITSPGGMPGTKRVQDYPNARQIPSRRRNKGLADLFERLGLMERKGSGFKKAFEDYEKIAVNLGGRIPQLESEDDFFRVTLPNLLYGFTDAQLVAKVDGHTPPVTPQVTPQVATCGDAVVTVKVRRVLEVMKNAPVSMAELRAALKIRDRAVVREDYLRPCFQGNLVELTLPTARKSPLQKYRLSAIGRMLAKKLSDSECDRGPVEGSSHGSGQGSKSALSPTTQETAQETTLENLTPIEMQIVALIRSDATISRKSMAEKVGLTSDGVKYHLNLLKNRHVLHHEGPTKKGRWVFDVAKKGGRK